MANDLATGDAGRRRRRFSTRPSGSFRGPSAGRGKGVDGCRRQRAERLLEIASWWAMPRTNIPDQLLEQLSLARPDDLVVLSRRIYWKEVLASKIRQLTLRGGIPRGRCSARPAVHRSGQCNFRPPPSSINAWPGSAHSCGQAMTSRPSVVGRARKGTSPARQGIAQPSQGGDRCSDYRRALDILDKGRRNCSRTTGRSLACSRRHWRSSARRSMRWSNWVIICTWKNSSMPPLRPGRRP